MSAFTAWRELLAEREAGPWPGPRPLKEHDEALLVGRDDDKDAFLREIDSHRLALLTGASGVGKTSLLEAGLLPKLRSAGYECVVCRRWAARLEETDPVSFLATKVRAQLEARGWEDLPTGRDLFWHLNRELGGKMVIVLDQFEELIRFDDAMTAAMFDLLVALNQRTKLKIVISFRSEYLHEMRPLERRAEPFSMSHFLLEEIDEEFAEEVALAGNKPGEPQAIDPAVASDLAEEWKAARKASEQRLNPTDRVGLLHLQALLYALHEKAGGGVVDAAVVEAFRNTDGAEGEPRGGVALYREGLLGSIEVKLARCEAAALAVEVGVDPFLLEGTTQAVARAVRHLSSAGFKLPRQAQELADRTLEDELESLADGIEAAADQGEPSEPQMEALFAALIDPIVPDEGAPDVDILTADRVQIARMADAAAAGDVSWEERLLRDAPSHLADPLDVTCGPMSGMAPAAVLIEELRRFAFALAWLQETTLVRISRPGTGDLVVTLIHDGFGSALIEWSEPVVERPAAGLHALTAPRGASFDWSEEIAGDEVAPLPLVNLRWRGAWVFTRFRNVLFVNCDFRGTFFHRCALDGVTFVNCLLDGVIFSDCAVESAYPAATGTTRLDEPVFAVKGVDPSLLGTIAHYRGLPGDPRWLLSHLPGAPAVPVESSEEPVAVPVPTGAVIHGGRVSSLVMRGCTGGISLRYVEGSGFDAVEGSSGDFEIFASQLRHLAFTKAVTRESEPIHITARHSTLAQVWLGESIRGSFDASDCTLVQVFNDAVDVDIEVKDSYYEGLIGLSVDESCTPLDDAKREEFSDTGETMDYRRNPALTKREREAGGTA